MSLNIRVRKARMRKHFTQRQLAVAIGVTQQAVQRLEAGKIKQTRKMECLATALEVCPYWLAFGPGNEPVLN